MNKEEILDKHMIKVSPFGTLHVSSPNAINATYEAMQEYADKQNKELQQQLAEKEKELQATIKVMQSHIDDQDAIISEKEKELSIKLTDYCHKCGDGCCTNYGTITEINGEELPCHNQDAETILKQVLEHLGYKVNIVTETDY